jgi:hypothetical protein
MVRDELRKTVGVLNPQRLSGPNAKPERKSAGLNHVASFYKKGLTWGQLEKSQFSESIRDANGVIQQPKSWK